MTRLSLSSLKGNVNWRSQFFKLELLSTTIKQIEIYILIPCKTSTCEGYSIPVNIYLFKANNRKLEKGVKYAQSQQKRLKNDAFTVKFEHISHLYCFYCWVSTDKCLLGCNKIIVVKKINQYSTYVFSFHPLLNIWNRYTTWKFNWIQSIVYDKLNIVCKGLSYLLFYVHNTIKSTNGTKSRFCDINEFGYGNISTC